MTLLEKYQNAFKDLKTQIVKGEDTIKLYVWSQSLLSNTMVKDVLQFNLDGSEKKKETRVNFY